MRADERGEGSGETLAPVISLFGAARVRASDDAASDAEEEPPRDAAVVAEEAEAALLRTLRGRQLSSAEAREMLRGRELHIDAVDDIVERFEGFGYLDDARLAEQVVHIAVTRKKQGRQGVARALSARGIAAEVADTALAALDTDDLDRAVEFARTRVRAMERLEREVALRRLTGQLARRGYTGSVARQAADRALDEIGGRGGHPTVRFR